MYLKEENLYFQIGSFGYMKETIEIFFKNVATSLNYVENVGRIQLHKLNSSFKFHSERVQFLPILYLLKQ